MPAERAAGARLDEASRRAWSEAMTVRPFGDAYLVECDEGTYHVSLAPSTCSCGGSTAENRCEHVRRVAIEINLGRVPPPSERTVPCAGCRRQVAVSAADSPPPLCAECRLEPGDLVVDETGDAETPLLVVSEPGRPADLVALPDDGRTVADYPGNGGYAADEPVVEVVYPRAVSTDEPPRRYLFPLGRLTRPGRAPGPPEREGAVPSAGETAAGDVRVNSTIGDEGATEGQTGDEGTTEKQTGDEGATEDR